VRKKTVVVIILGLVVLGSMLLALLYHPPGTAAPRGAAYQGQAVGIIRIEGVISSGGSDGGLFGGSGTAADSLNQLRQAAEDSQIKAVVLRIDSPGGSAAASQEIGEEVQKLRQAGKKVVVSMGDVAASGGYWIAAGADRIIANPATMTGSIGVIMEIQNLEELFKKLGIRSDVIKSGPHKDIGSPTRALTSAERDILQGMVNDIYTQFVDVVAEGRKGKMTRDQVQAIADGRGFTGRQALKIGLVDQLGNFYDAIDEAAKLAGIPGKPEVKDLVRPNPLRFLFPGAQGKGLIDPARNLSAQEWQALKRILEFLPMEQ